MRYFQPLLPFVLGWALILSSESLSALGLINGLAQLLLFGLVVCLPTWRTGRMSYVDIGWPWGLVLLALLALVFSESSQLRLIVFSALLAGVGLRMGLGALNLWRSGKFRKEFPRYQYQRLRWAEEGKSNVPLALQVDALSQGLANASFLALPILIIGTNPEPGLMPLEIMGLVISFLALGLESVADYQKVQFLRGQKRKAQHNQVCDVGLWRWCRHPNYFFEWMVWNGMVISAVPSWLMLGNRESLTVWLLLGAGLLLASGFMYRTLVFITGAIPSEYYSARKRPDYVNYQAVTNRFFPGIPKSTTK